MEIAPGIHRLATNVGDRSLFQHVLVDERIVLVDSGCTTTPEDLIFPYLRRLGREPAEIAAVIVSHSDADHFGGNHQVRQASPRAVIACGEADIPWVESRERLVRERYDQFRADHGFGLSEKEYADSLAMMGPDVPVDLGLAGGESFRLGPGWRVQVLHTPGHSAGHLSVYDPRSRTVIICDAVLSVGLKDAKGERFALPPTYRDAEPYLATIAALERLEVETLATSHFPLMRGREVREFLAESRAWAYRAEDVLVGLLRERRQGAGLLELIREASPRLGEWPHEGMEGATGFPILGHLERLVAVGTLRAERRNGLLHYALAR